MKQLDHASACEVARTRTQGRVPVDRALVAWEHSNEEFTVESHKLMNELGRSMCGPNQKCWLHHGAGFTLAFAVYESEMPQ
jgi:hypothetical protein